LNTIYLIVGIINLLMWCGGFIEWLWGVGRVKTIDGSSELCPLETYPTLSVVIPARNEEGNIAQTVESILSQNYPGLELIVVNDRSTDNTENILDAIQEKHPQIKLFHCKELPPGWLGKNHAMYFGSMQTESEWILFTDADVKFMPECLKKTVGYAVRNKLDHFTMLPGSVANGALYKIFLVSFSMIFNFAMRPWRAQDPKSKASAGIGAFNLIKRSAYIQIGTCKSIALRPDEDYRLGQLVKKNGLRQDVVYGGELILVEWYKSVAEAINGLNKNVFAALDYNLSLAVFSVFMLLFAHIIPFVGVVFANGATKVIFIAVILMIFYINRYYGKYIQVPFWYALFHPVGVMILLYAMTKATVSALVNDCIEWRGTKYPLDLLKNNVV